MLSRLFIRMVALSCIAFGTACGGDSPEVSLTQDTEVDLFITDPASASEELALLIDFVSYMIACPASGLAPYDDSVNIAGTFEINHAANPPVWQLATNLPLSTCTVALWVYYEDEVVCSGTQSLPLIDDGDASTTNKINIVLECTLSVDSISGDADIDSSFDLVHGNYCPRLFWLGAVPSAGDPAVMNVEATFLDEDAGCGQNCDPRTCDVNANPPTCAPAPDPGLTSTLFAPAGNGTFTDASAANTTYNCDPLFPGPTDLCIVVSDGDLECDRTRCLTVDCP